MAGREVISYSGLIRRTGERLLQDLKEPKGRVIYCIGWKGIGRWRVAEYAAKNAMESRRLFDVLIWVQLRREEWSATKVQRIIAESLGIQPPVMDSEEGDTDIDTAMRIYAKLKASKFLLVMGDAFDKDNDFEHNDLLGMGVPNVRRSSSAASVSNALSSKVVLIGHDRKTQYDREHRFEVDIERGVSSAADVWDLFREEAALAAHSPRTKGYFTPDIVMDCLLYLSLFQGYDSNIPWWHLTTEWLTRYWIAEGFIEGETEVVLAERLVLLMEELRDRSFVFYGIVDLRLPRTLMYSHVKAVAAYITSVRGHYHHRFWIGTKMDSLPRDDDHEWGAIKRMSLVTNSGVEVHLAPSPQCPNLSTFVLTCTGDDVRLSIPLNFFEHMKGLRVLDLTGTLFGYLPSSLSSLCNLRLLMLKSCSSLKSLPTSLRALEKLKFLDLCYCRSLETIPDESFELMNNLRILDLSHTEIRSLPSSISSLYNLQQLLLTSCGSLTEIPEKCFERMRHLEILDLSFAYSLKSLPSSLFNLVNLRVLKLDYCSSLKTGVRPQSLQNLPLLEVLELNNCEEIEDLQDVSFKDIFPNIKQVHLSHIRNLERLSFRGCQSLEMARFSYLGNLKVLDISGTKLSQFPSENIWGMTSLKRLDMLPMEYINRVAHSSGKDILLEELNWSDDGVGARIWVTDPNFFEKTSSSIDLFETKCFSRFYIRISPCEEEWHMSIATPKIQNIHFQRGQFVYKHIYFRTQSYQFGHFKNTYDRHLEISRGNSFQDVHYKIIDGVLAHTQLLTLFNNSFVERLTDLCYVTELRELEECRIWSCQMIKSVFSGKNPDFDILMRLEVLWLSALSQLISACEGIYGCRSFALLKHIYLERCPKLVTVFTSSLYLENLETLEINFCARLESVFGEEKIKREDSFKSLQSLCLWKLPKLKSICNGYLSQLRKVKVGGCRKLRKLPIRVRVVECDQDAASSLPMVEIVGELDWWKNLEWAVEEDAIKHPAHFRARGPLLQ